ncbi:adenylyl-sulfate kinase [Winogradskyella immobilis]|uniref:Adenylyl-sulfate kinase n=1 Tax=Winogradskyella immobilis TaxID=2816852 RepID=A0ABS8EJU7_9FLAO|nr:adenylyl-sulfate kinase [Winogradskyella immobilis]MCC1483474.1 adenylyl-sulfate kinase [Winogradskyella immobilis]MCG0015568.1 adenylyl-sulfate kinase [Winogradskyella immobilis]
MKKNVLEHNFKILNKDRVKINGHKPLLIWFTGLSGSGKSTIANLLEQELYKKRIHTYVLDGDNIRKGINKDLTFSPEHRTENIRRVAEVAHLMMDAGLVVLAAFISPYKEDRIAIKNIVKEDNFVEVYINTSLEECERRDVKGLYKMARKGEIEDMTGISSPYEAPEHPNIEIKTEKQTQQQATEMILKYIQPKLKI